MYLDVVERADDIRSNDLRALNIPSFGLRTDDIRGARPARNPFTNKASFLGSDDIPGTKPAQLYPAVRKATDLSLKCRDIEGAFPHRIDFRTDRCTDPLQPQYVLPSFKLCPPEELKYSGRPTNYIDDITGARPQKLVQDVCRTIPDPITGSSPAGTRHFRNRPQFDSLNVSDINNGDRRKLKMRNTNPLDPQYTLPISHATSVHHQFSQESVSPMRIESKSVGFIHGSAPRKMRWVKDAAPSSLMSSDIQGARPQRHVGTLVFSANQSLEERPPHYVGETSLIEGAQHGSLKRGLITGRQTDPLEPIYDMQLK
jgi:hypothetical protein